MTGRPVCGSGDGPATARAVSVMARGVGDGPRCRRRPARSVVARGVGAGRHEVISEDLYVIGPLSCMSVMART